MGSLFGLAAAFGWGGADFIARHSARRISSYATFVSSMQCVGLTAVSLYFLVVRDCHWNGFSAALASPARQAWE